MANGDIGQLLARDAIQASQSAEPARDVQQAIGTGVQLAKLEGQLGLQKEQLEAQKQKNIQFKFDRQLSMMEMVNKQTSKTGRKNALKVWENSGNKLGFQVPDEATKDLLVNDDEFKNKFKIVTATLRNVGASQELIDDIGKAVSDGLSLPEAVDKLLSTSQKAQVLEAQKGAAGKTAEVAGKKQETKERTTFLKEKGAVQERGAAKALRQQQTAITTIGGTLEQLDEAIRTDNVQAFNDVIKGIIAAKEGSKISDTDFRIIAERPGIAGLFDRFQKGILNKVPKESAKNLRAILDQRVKENEIGVAASTKALRARIKTLSQFPSADTEAQMLSEFGISAQDTSRVAGGPSVPPKAQDQAAATGDLDPAQLTFVLGELQKLSPADQEATLKQDTRIPEAQKQEIIRQLGE